MTRERPEALQAWTAVCDVVDRGRVAINRDLQHAVGLTLAENLVLCQVAMTPGKSLRMAEIAGLLTIAKSAVTKTVDRLEDRGLITREKDPADRRTIHATLTAEGETLFVAAQPAFVEAVQRHFADHISEADIRCLAGLPGRMRQTAFSARANGERTGVAGPRDWSRHRRQANESDHPRDPLTSRRP